ncbi:helix-turn-helix transcriptional regulator [Maribacter sp. HTCC2170]|uniref:helix-turn-helix transcriptional regulator n=1 Tax=Maribacter sp. (strain HTCC2170 / KCCM 42371) TaxID=313603 RepID=UPI00006B2242|nr:helix-turn-helix transcriptional regulator [Maribacter sp. HTCC2170]EAR00353.1 two-component system regulator [Maribacter sp. HTCC2170]
MYGAPITFPSNFSSDSKITTKVLVAFKGIYILLTYKSPTLLSLTFIVVFIFCFAIAIAAVLLGHGFILTYNTAFHRNYFYYLVTFFGFAFYAIWGQILMRVLLESMNTDSKEIEMIANFLPVLGVPFLLISWIMLLKMGHSLLQIPIKNNLIRSHLVIFILIIPIVWGLYSLLGNSTWFLGIQLAYTLIGIIMLIELLYMVIFIGTVIRHSKKQNRPHDKTVKQFVFFMLLGFCIRVVVVPFLFMNSWLLAALILFYFLSNLIPLLYLRQNSDLIFTPISAVNPVEEKKTLIFEKYGITKREREIVEQICKGKTNQQIADELFISLQTVKDHTHRIYTKIGIKGRMNLVQLVNG